jgi:sporulation protein YlmC with PRC-barrel domain
MNQKFTILLTGAIMIGASLSCWAQSGQSNAPFGHEKQIYNMENIEIENFQGQKLGRVLDMGIDLVNGRIVEVLVQCDASLGLGDKVVAVPPLALVPDKLNETYYLNASADVFKSAAAIDLSQWTDYGRSDRVAAAYHLFKQETYFLEEGDTPSMSAARPKVPLGYVERTSNILNMHVKNFQDEKLGKVCSINLSIPRGRIRSVDILAPGLFKTESVVPAMALSFNSVRDGLLLDDSKLQYAGEPRLVFTEAEYGNEAYTREQNYKGPHTDLPLQQGASYRDVDRTSRIYKSIRDAKLADENIEVGTFDGRVTLRGWADSAEDKARIFQIAVAASREELVDDQVMVGRPSAAN